MRLLLMLALLCSLLSGCGAGSADQTGVDKPPQRGRGAATGPRGGMGGRGAPGGAPQQTAIPVRVAEVERRRVSDYLQTTGALEAENEVDIVARTSGPITELLTEEGRTVKKGQLLARIDDRELKADLDLARVSVEETRAAFERAKRSFDEAIISAEEFEVTKARYETAEAQIRSREIQLGYTEIRSPFDGRIIDRAIKLGEFVNVGTRLFRVSDFDPLLCKVHLPEKDLSRVRTRQSAVVSVEAFPGQTFGASVLRINPVMDQANGTFKVTLQVRGKGKLRPGMFAAVFLEVGAHENALVVPKRALVLEGVGDTVYVFEDGVAKRRDVQLGFEETNDVEVVSGLSGDEQIIVLGQDSLTDGTPIYVLERQAAGPDGAQVLRVDDQPSAGSRTASKQTNGSPGTEDASGSPAQPPASQSMTGSEVPPVQSSGPPQNQRGGARGRPNIDWDDPEQVGKVKERMRSFGMTEEQIEQRIERMKKGGARRSVPSEGGRGVSPE